MQLGVVDEVTEVSQSSLLNVKDKASLSASKCCTLGSTDHHQLLFGHSKSKVQKDGNPTQFYKVFICPVIFFSDDTSGGNSKQFLPYESWSMVHAALPFEDRGRRENTKYLGCVPKSEGLSSISFIPGIAADMKRLEEGIKMYSSVYDEIVIVKAPVMFVMADNPAHSDICGLLQQTTQCACRKCYFPKVIRRQKQTVTEANVSMGQLNNVYVRRTREHYAIAASDADRSNPKINVLEDVAVSASENLGFMNTVSDALL